MFDSPASSPRPTGKDQPQRLRLALARTPAEVDEALRLRHKVFAQEMGAQLGSAELDRDEFDACCDHLIVREHDSQRVVGTYRILPPHRVRELGRSYSQGEFDLARLVHLAPGLVEVGRACVHRDHRSGPTLLMLWAGLARYMRQGGYTHMLGCASVGLADGGANAAAVRDQLARRHFTSIDQRCFPLLPFPHERIERAGEPEVPALLNAYLRLGGKIGGEPAWDPDFNTADFLVLLALADLSPRHARHFGLLAANMAT